MPINSQMMMGCEDAKQQRDPCYVYRIPSEHIAN